MKKTKRPVEIIVYENFTGTKIEHEIFRLASKIKIISGGI